MFAAEREQLPRQVGGVAHRQHDLFEGFPRFLRQGRTDEQQGGVTLDDLQVVVEIMRHPAGELADRLQLLGVPVLFLQLAPRGDVPERPDASIIPARLVPHRRMMVFQHPAVHQHDLLLADFVRMRLDVGQPVRELFRILHPGRDLLEHPGVILIAGHGVRQVEHLLEARIFNDGFTPVVQHQDAVEGGIHQRFKKRRAPAQLILRPPVFRARARFAQGPAHHRAEAFQAVLQHIIRRAGAEAFHRALFPDGARNNDERNVETARLQQRHGPRGRKLRQGVIRKNHVQMRPQAGQVFRLCFHPLPLQLVARAVQLAGQQQGVVLGIFDDQSVQGWFHVVILRVLGVD